VYLLETGINNTAEDDGVEKLTWVVDFATFSFSIADSTSKNIALAVIDIVQNHYPERLGLGVLLNTPFYFNILWAVGGVPIPSCTCNS